MNDDDRNDDDRIDKERAKRRASMITNMNMYLSDPETNNLIQKHPRPWTWEVVYYDGLGFQFFNARKEPILSALIYDEDLAAELFLTLGNIPNGSEV